MRHVTPWTAVVSFAITIALTLVAHAEQGPLPDHRGYAEYQQYCASCHGVRGDGKGPMAPALKVPPADLRRLASRYGSPLPRPKLVAFIDGREMVRGHGSREMPVWGKTLDPVKAGDAAHESHMRGMILVIIDYLDAIQVDAPDAAKPDAGSDAGKRD